MSLFFCTFVPDFEIIASGGSPVADKLNIYDHNRTTKRGARPRG